MNEILYWAILLDDVSKEKLLSFISPIHPNIYAEHITLCFKPIETQNKKWGFLLGKRVKIESQDYYEDEYGQAITITGITRDDNKPSHITISCANGVGPVYSNQLISGDKKDTIRFKMEGRVAKRTKIGWISNK